MGLRPAHPPDGQVLDTVDPQVRPLLTPVSGREHCASLPRYWPVLDNALRAAAFNKRVHVRLLVSCWLNTDPTMFAYLRSLQAFSDPSAGISVDVVRN